jgi:selenide,water dikinase
LAQVLRQVPAVVDPRVLVDAATRDDAAVFKVALDRALVATVDFFTPIVDEPYTFGRIAAANALSDLYAMGARPLFGLNLVAWPRAPEVLALLGDTLRGGAAVAAEAGMLILGGHSIDDPEPKYGLVAIGEVHPDRILTVGGALPGDALVLTKPLGTGILSTALKRDLIGEAEMAEAVRWMTTLNAAAMEGVLAVGDAAHACTDVTGFGLLGHLHNMLRASGAAARLRWNAVRFLPGTLELAQRGAIPGGTARNLEAAAAFTHFHAGVPEPARVALADAQTSGGLLTAVAFDAVDALLHGLHEQGVAGTIIGSVTPATSTTIGAIEVA